MDREKRELGHLISVIIPVYNTEPYLMDCVESVQKQTYPAFELILIDDGSEDQRGQICQKASVEDQRILFLHQEHKGVSAARNYGIKAANGKYLFFMDSDDVIHPELLETLCMLLEKHHAVLATGGYRLTNTEELKKRSENIYNMPQNILLDEAVPGSSQMCRVEYDYLTNQEALENFPLETPEYKLFAIGGKMILRDAVQEIQFHTELANAEDVLFIYHLFNQGADAVVLRRSWYFHRMHDHNACMKRTVAAYQSQYEVAKEIREQEKKKGRIKNAVNWEIFIIKHLFGWYYINEQEQKNEELGQYLDKVMRIEKKEKTFFAFDWYIRLKYNLALKNFPLYYKLYLAFWKDKQCSMLDIFPEGYQA